MVSVTLKELLEAGAHFGHQTRRWNPKMKEYIFGARNGIYIIDLQKTVKLFRDALTFVERMSAEGGNVLFVGTKRQAQETIAEEASRAGGTHPPVFSSLFALFGAPRIGPKKTKRGEKKE